MAGGLLPLLPWASLMWQAASSLWRFYASLVSGAPFILVFLVIQRAD